MKNILFLFLLISACSGQPEIKFVEQFDNANHPSIVYWFWDDHTITDKQYLKDIDKMAAHSPFDMIVPTPRFIDSVGFWDTEKMKPYLKEAVDYAHQKGLKVVLQIYCMNRSTPVLFIRDFPVKKEDAEALIAEGECVLDAKGTGKVVNKPIPARYNKIIHAEAVKIWLFKKTADGFYEAASLKEADPEWLNIQIHDDMSVEAGISAPAAYAGYHAYVATAHYYNFFDVVSQEHSNIFKKMLDDYSDIPFDGAAVDENGNMGLLATNLKNAGVIMTERTWSDDFAAYYRNTYSSDPVRLLFDMRYAPENKPEVRIKAINTYFEARTKGPLQPENFFYDYSKKLFGKDCFIGVHSTIHNSLTNDEVWSSGIDWWDLPREYGQTDERTPMPDRLGVGISGSQPIMYNMFYHKDKEAMFHEALDPAAYGVREHYHAWNDNYWGKNVEDDDFLEDLKPIESRIRLLNHFNPVAPRLPLLVIYNFPYIFNWYPDKDQLNIMGIRQIDMQPLSSSIWKAGYPCAAIPSTWLERGLVTVRDDGKVQIKDRVFEAVIFLYPQYAKSSSFTFMNELLGKKGALMIRGTATNDFDGNDCSGLFEEISRQALPFAIDKIPELGVSVNPIPNGTFLQDGSVVMSNYNSVKDKTRTSFNIQIGENEFIGNYQGVFALKTDKKGRIEKLACGNFQSLKRNGITILELQSPADIYITTVKGKQVITIKGSNEIITME
ncbi:MAG: hypothetical protein LBT78_02985 [Tannerella sp.]|jgi:hypothetical protein|nr:hypothetical protein [Tannerella sp.]